MNLNTSQKKEEIVGSNPTVATIGYEAELDVRTGIWLQHLYVKSLDEAEIIAGNEYYLSLNQYQNPRGQCKV